MLSKIKKILVWLKDYLLGNDIATEIELKAKPPTWVDVCDVELIDRLDLDKYSDAVKYAGKVGKPKILIMDDLKITLSLYTTDFDLIKIKYGVDVYEDFEIYLALGKEAGYQACKFIRDSKPEYLVLDITIENLTKFDDGNYLDLDGLDIAKYNDNNNPGSKFIISTAHKLTNNKSKENIVTKFKKYFGVHIKHHSMSKNVDREINLYNFLYGDKNG